MKKYYKQLNDNGEVVAFLTYDYDPVITDPLIIEVTEEEYVTVRAELREKTKLVNQLYRNKITIDDVPEEWRDDIQQKVDDLIATRGEYTPTVNETALKAQAYDIITGVIE